MVRKTSSDAVLDRVDALIARIESFVPRAALAPAWEEAIAFRWRKDRWFRGNLEPVIHPHRVRLDELCGIDRQKEAVVQNTRQFVRGVPANNILLSGSRGTGKSSLIKAVLNAFAPDGLRLIEVEKYDLVDLPDIVDPLYGRPERFILFCDDLSFEADDATYKALKAILDGSVSAPPENVLIYATSNRRHLLPEYLRENLDAHYVEGEVHQSEAVEEKISLSERFGLWLTFYPFNQDDYLEIVYSWLAHFGVSAEESDEIRAEALKWALTRGSRSGRSAYQFARDWTGRSRLGCDEQ